MIQEYTTPEFGLLRGDLNNQEVRICEIEESVSSIKITVTNIKQQIKREVVNLVRLSEVKPCTSKEVMKKLYR